MVSVVVGATVGSVAAAKLPHASNSANPANTGRKTLTVPILNPSILTPAVSDSGKAGSMVIDRVSRFQNLSFGLCSPEPTQP